MPDVPSEFAGAIRDRYVVEREIGSGGMANVFLALDVRHNRYVAVKVLKPELAASLGAERFLKEIEIAAGLGQLAGKVWRIGLMGYNSRPENVTLLLAAMDKALKALA